MRNLGRSGTGDFVVYLTEREVAQLLGFDVPSEPGAQQALDAFEAKPATDVVPIVQEATDAAKLRRTGKTRLEGIQQELQTLEQQVGNLVASLP